MAQKTPMIRLENELYMARIFFGSSKGLEIELDDRVITFSEEAMATKYVYALVQSSEGEITMNNNFGLRARTGTPDKMWLEYTSFAAMARDMKMEAFDDNDSDVSSQSSVNG